MTPATRRRAGITVIGVGSAPAAVDQVTINLGVEIIRDAPGEAFQAAADTASRVLTVLADAGVSARSVRTSDLSLGPRTEYHNGRQVLLGYAAGQRLTVLLEGLDGIDVLLTRVATLGGEGVRIDGVALTAGHPESAQAAARTSAFQDATAKAQHLAELSGRALGQVDRIDDRVPGGGPRPMMAMRAAADAMPVATGDTQVTVELLVHFSFS